MTIYYKFKINFTYNFSAYYANVHFYVAPILIDIHFVKHVYSRFSTNTCFTGSFLPFTEGINLFNTNIFTVYIP